LLLSISKRGILNSAYFIYYNLQNRGINFPLLILRPLRNLYFVSEGGLFFSSLRGVGPMGRKPRLSTGSRPRGSSRAASHFIKAHPLLYVEKNCQVL